MKKKSCIYLLIYILEDTERLKKQQVLEGSRSCRVKAQRVNKEFGNTLFFETLPSWRLL